METKYDGGIVDGVEGLNMSACRFSTGLAGCLSVGAGSVKKLSSVLAVCQTSEQVAYHAGFLLNKCAVQVHSMVLVYP